MSRITIKELEALEQWQLIHGRHWRAALSKAWMDGFDRTPLFSDHQARLQGLRNRLGPTWLATFSLGAALRKAGRH